MGVSESNLVEEQSVVCDMHGAYVARRIVLAGRAIGPYSICPQCAEAQSEREHAERRQRDAMERQQRLEKRLNRAGIPLRFRGKTFEIYIADTEAKQAAKHAAMAYAADFRDRLAAGACMVFSGSPGTGKSHLACAIAQHIMEAGHTAMYRTAMDMVRMIRATWRRDSERSEEDVLHDLVSVDLLILDEVGMQYGSEGEQVIMTDVIDQRYRNQMPILILTNQNRKGLSEYLGHRAFDRLRDGGTWESFDWESYRK